MAGVVEQQSRQQVVGFVAYDGAMVRPFDSDRSLLTRSLDFLLLSSSKTIRRSRDRASRDAGARRPARGMGMLPIGIPRNLQAPHPVARRDRSGS